MSFCKDCVIAVRHEGTPEGKWPEEIGGVKCYVATPTFEYPENKVLLFIPDIFGVSLINAQLLADDFARSGIKTVIPDYLNGDDAPADGPGNKSFNLQAWLANHGAKETRPPIDKVVAALKEQGVTAFGATGYCFGARYVFDLAIENVIQVAIVAHPSSINVPEDLEKYRSSSKAPLLINSCEEDKAFPPEAQAKADEILGGEKYAAGYKRLFWKGCRHGFAVRGDMTNEDVKRGKEGAFKASVEWIHQYL